MSNIYPKCNYHGNRVFKISLLHITMDVTLNSHQLIGLNRDLLYCPWWPAMVMEEALWVWTQETRPDQTHKHTAHHRQHYLTEDRHVCVCVWKCVSLCVSMCLSAGRTTCLLYQGNQSAGMYISKTIWLLRSR